ncbi:MAG: hypothetical protein RIC35_12160 [Marinoscillum sp.]
MYRLILILTFAPIFAWGYTSDTIRLSQDKLLVLKDTIFAPNQDTIIVLEDDTPYRIKTNPYKSTEDFYQKLREKTGQNKVTARLFELLYVDKKYESELKKKKVDRTSNQPFMPFEGKHIGKITIKHVDLIEGNVNDTSRQATSYVARTAEKFHINTWNRVIRNTLNVKSGEELNPYTVADGERLLRRLRFVKDARIYIAPSADSEEVELIVVIQDRFSWGLNLDIDQIDDFGAKAINRSILGTGKFASASYLFEGNTPNPHGYAFSVGGQNINKAITNWELNHFNINTRKEWGASLQKEFVSPEIKYGGGLDVRNVRDTTIFLDGQEASAGYYALGYYDLWLGRAFKLPSQYSRKNITMTLRWLNNEFSSRPFVSADTNTLYYNRNLWLSEISISSQKFLKSNYVRSFGISEDIPIGYRLSVIGGKDFNEFFEQDYLGIKMFWSFYILDLGYLLLNQEIGNFYHDEDRQGVYKATINYFSPLLEFNRYYIRNFFKLTYSKGINQPLNNEISLRGKIRDINGDLIYGSGSISLSVESITYTPWYFYGFRFAPFFYYNIGELWDYRDDRSYSVGYQGVGLGCRIRNENLAFSTIELRYNHFLTGPQLDSQNTFSLSTTFPINFGNIFRFKPTLVTY